MRAPNKYGIEKICNLWQTTCYISKIAQNSDTVARQSEEEPVRSLQI